MDQMHNGNCMNDLKQRDSDHFDKVKLVEEVNSDSDEWVVNSRLTKKSMQGLWRSVCALRFASNCIKITKTFYKRCLPIPI